MAFASEKEASDKLSTADVPLTTSMWLPRLDPKQREAFAGFGFEASASDIAVATKFEEADTVTSDTVRARLGSD